MSSHHPPAKDENPFGYTFNTDDIDHAAAEENVTAAGPPLLSEDQCSHLQSFFDHGPFNTFTNNFTFSDADLHASNDLAHAFNYDIFAEPPPNFHGTINDATQPSSIFGGLDRPMAAAYAVPSHNDARGGASDEVIGAANALLSGAQPQGDPTYAEKEWGNYMGLPSPPASAAFTSASDQRNLTALATANHDTKAAAPSFFDPHTFASLGASSSGASRPQPDANFGTDTSFSGGVYTAPSKTDTEGTAWGRMLQDMRGGLRLSESGPNTRPPTQPSSPTLSTRPSFDFATYGQGAHQVKQQPSSPKHTIYSLGIIPIEPTPAASDDESASDGDISPGGRPVKRRRTINERGLPARPKLSEVSLPSASSQRSSSFSGAARPRKQRDSTVDTPAKKRAASKQPRENLTEEQKRSNHIQSEQKRRNLIKQGFDEMNELVPALRAGGFSKSSTLLEGAKFLEDLIVGNQILRRALGEV
ncbi:hlh transcription factor [Diplodia corticola]|uniref:Hlh transcription factor n=1 Tax=Diplodia corticola TaxID=236234 RepID=A0A1J9RSI1_9PEZI|nr:hlh transcription factor [Diplodia corticola]OJD35515.1 hlh transcription factor [Diplodia corticola]